LFSQKELRLSCSTDLAGTGSISSELTCGQPLKSGWEPIEAGVTKILLNGLPQKFQTPTHVHRIGQRIHLKTHVEYLQDCKGYA
jgi:hypothetical protein